MKLYLVIIVLLLFIVASCCNNKHKNNHVIEKFISEPYVSESRDSVPEGLASKHHEDFRRLKLKYMSKETKYFKDLNIGNNGVISYKDFYSKDCFPHLRGRIPDGPDKGKKMEDECLKLWRSYLSPEIRQLSDTELKKSTSKIRNMVKYSWMGSWPRKNFLKKNIKDPTDDSPGPITIKQAPVTCKGPPACKKATKTLDRDGKQTFKRCKSGCGTKIPKLGYICCDKGCCNKKSVETDTVKTAVRKTTENIKELSNIGQNLNTSNSVNGSSVSGQNATETRKEISSLKKQIAKQNKKIENLDAKVINSNDKYFANVKNRDSKLIEANDGVEPIDPGSFSFKPEIKFDHKQPNPKIASSYGWSFMPPQFWSVPQKRPPSCVPSKQNTATVTPIYDKSVPVDALDYTQVGSMLPKFKYKEIHNPDYYYPGYIAKKDEPYPGKNGRKVMKTGEYYNMKLARSTGLEPRKGIKFGKTIIDDNVVPHKAIRKTLDRSLPVAKPGKNKRARPGCGIIKGNPALSHHCNNAKKTLVKDENGVLKHDFSRCKSGCDVKIPGLGRVCCKTKCCTAQPKSVAKKVIKSRKVASNNKSANSKPLDKEQSAHEKSMAKQRVKFKKMAISMFKKADTNNDTKVTKSEALKFYEAEYRRGNADTLLKGKSEAEIKELVKNGFETGWKFFFLDGLKFPPNTVEISFNKFIKHFNEAVEREKKEHG